MVVDIIKANDPLSKDYSEQTEVSKHLNHTQYRKTKKLKIPKIIFFSSLVHKTNCYQCVFPACSKNFPTYFRWKIHHIIHVIFFWLKIFFSKRH